MAQIVLSNGKHVFLQGVEAKTVIDQIATRQGDYVRFVAADGTRFVNVAQIIEVRDDPGVSSGG
jgi:hypothetical protein